MKIGHPIFIQVAVTWEGRGNKGPISHKGPVTRQIFPFDDVIMHYGQNFVIDESFVCFIWYKRVFLIISKANCTKLEMFCQCSVGEIFQFFPIWIIIKMLPKRTDRFHSPDICPANRFQTKKLLSIYKHLWALLHLSEIKKLGNINQFVMMTSSNGNIFRVTSPLCGEFTGRRWIPLTKASDAELWCFLWSAPE